MRFWRYPSVHAPHLRMPGRTALDAALHHMNNCMLSWASVQTDRLWTIRFIWRPVRNAAKLCTQRCCMDVFDGFAVLLELGCYRISCIDARSCDRTAPPQQSKWDWVLKNNVVLRCLLGFSSAIMQGPMRVPVYGFVVRVATSDSCLFAGILMIVIRNCIERSLGCT